MAFIQQKIIKHPDTYSSKFLKICYRHKTWLMFWLKITVFAIFTEIYSFRLNVIWETNVVGHTKCCTGQSLI